MNKKALKTLEYNKIIDKVAFYAVSPMAKEMIYNLQPSTNLRDIKLWQKETSEAVSMILKKGTLRLSGLRDIRPFLKRVAVSGSLSILDLLQIGEFLYTSNNVKNYSKIESKNDVFEILQSRFDEIQHIEILEKEINRCIKSETEIFDDASTALREIRRNIKSSNDRIKEQLNNIIHSQSYKSMLQDPVITLRNDRYCVPIKAEYKNSFLGIVHDQSSTGVTVFIEPSSVVELNNKIKDLVIKEKNEIERILFNLSKFVDENKDILYTNFEALVYLDFVFAKGEYSISINGTEPIFNTNGYVNIKKGCHPLLDKDKVVPTDIYLGKEFTTLLITGPNTGGKTVCLKTVGLFTLMGQAGLHIAAFDKSELAIFDNVFSDIGDEQSIEQSLSTFSGHMSNIISILNEITSNSLVILDELGAGTDPIEGAVLAISIIEHLHSRKIRTLATTHYSELKVFAISTDGVENGACEFDVETLRPTYRLLIGVPGKSNAFSISKRLGLPDFLIENAKKILSTEDARLEDVITDLEISKKTLVLEQERAERYRKEAQSLKDDVQIQKKKTREQKEKILLLANEEARIIIAEAKIQSDKIIKDMQKLLRDNQAFRELDERRQKLKENLADADKKIDKLKVKKQQENPMPKKIEKGMRVIVNSLNQKGVITSLPNQKGEVMVKSGIMNIKINIRDLSLDVSEPEENLKKQVSNKKFVSNKVSKVRNISMELDLRGLLANEAIEKVDKYIDDAYLSGVGNVTIIHGKGTGALKVAVHDYLRKNRHIKGFRLGEFGEGDAGVTVVTLK